MDSNNIKGCYSADCHQHRAGTKYSFKLKAQSLKRIQNTAAGCTLQANTAIGPKPKAES